MRYCSWNVGRYCHPSSGVSTSERVKESIKENNEVSKNGWYVWNITQLLLLIIFLLKRHDSGTFLCLAKHYRKIVLVLVLVLYYLSKRSALPFFPDSETFLCLAKHYRKIVLVLVLYYLSKRSALPFFPRTTA